MPATDTVMAALERNWGMVDRALDGMDEATMARRPNEHCNSVASLVVTILRMPRASRSRLHLALSAR